VNNGLSAFDMKTVKARQQIDDALGVRPQAQQPLRPLPQALRPMQQGQMPMQQGQMPMQQGQMQQMPMQQGQMQQMPMQQGQMPTQQGQMPMQQGQMPMQQGQTPMQPRQFAKGGLAMAEGGAWTRKEGQNPEGGLNAKGRASLKAQGKDIKPPVSAKQAKKSPKAAARRKSFCARMSGMPGPMEDDKGRPTRKALSLRKWDC
jgi:hypothetical protein